MSDAPKRRPSLFDPGRTCREVAPARHAALLCDNDSFFEAAREALLAARQSIMLLGWTFDPRTRLGAPTGDCPSIGELLNRVADERPEVDIRLVIWDAPLFISAAHEHFPQRARRMLRPRIRFRLDESHPPGASHHEKVLVIDDRLAFCSGEDFSAERWDSSRHLDADARRELPSGRPYEPRHGASMVVDGAAARALGKLARERWRDVTGEEVAPGSLPEVPVWPERVEPQFRDVPVAVTRTAPEWRGRDAVREGEELFLAAIAAARRTIYIESQYFASPEVTEALARRLDEEDGPEVILICSPFSPSFFDRMTMDPARNALVGCLENAQNAQRLRIYAPHGPEGRPVVVHSKIMVVDDFLLRAGSSNLNRRSLRLDTECDLAIEARDDEEARRRAILERRNGTVAHFLGCGAGDLERALLKNESLCAAIDALDTGPARRLRPIRPQDSERIIARVALKEGWADPGLALARVAQRDGTTGTAKRIGGWMAAAAIVAFGLGWLARAARRPGGAA